ALAVMWDAPRPSPPRDRSRPLRSGSSPWGTPAPRIPSPTTPPGGRRTLPPPGPAAFQRTPFRAAIPFAVQRERQTAPGRRSRQTALRAFGPRAYRALPSLPVPAAAGAASLLYAVLHL